MSSRIALIALLCAGATSLAIAQTTPSQNPPKEAPTTSSSASSPASASSPHQRQATGKEAINDCIAKHRAQDSSMTKSAAKKACEQEMKAHSSTSG